MTIDLSCSSLVFSVGETASLCRPYCKVGLLPLPFCVCEVWFLVTFTFITIPILKSQMPLRGTACGHEISFGSVILAVPVGFHKL
jgi:hypothetical protein